MRVNSPTHLHLSGPRGIQRGVRYVCRLAFAWIALVSGAVACTRGSSDAASPSARREPLAPQAAAQSQPLEQASDRAWQEGRLPPSVLEGTPRSGGELVVGVDVEPNSLNTLTSTDWLAKRIVLQRIGQALVRVDANDDPRFRIVPALAERWEVSPDGRTYTFHLRAGVTWHDGQPFSASDVLATFDKLRDPQVDAAGTRSDFEELARYSAPDPATVVLEWKRPYFLVLDALADLPIQPAHVIAKLSPAQYNAAATNPLNRAPIGTGPFKFVSWESQGKIVLERNPHYWGRPTYLDRLVFRIVPDPGVRMQLAERGELDLLYRVKPDQWVGMNSAALREHWHRSRFYPAKYQWIGWNQQHPLLADVRVRRALTQLIDRPSIIDKLMHGLPRATTCHFYWASAACDPALTPLPYDPEAAAQLLDSADVRDHDGDGIRDRNGVPLRFGLLLPSSSRDATRIAALIKEDLARQGVEVRLEMVEWSALLQRVNEHTFDAVTMLWSGDARMDPTQIWHSRSHKAGTNFIGYHNAEVDRLIEEARVTLDDNTRNALFRRFGAIIHAEQPYTFLFVPAELDLLHERVKGARPSLYWWQPEDMWLEAPKGA
ncbi:MAG: peptide-binding protein [Polyangiales bacterium]